MTVFGTISDLVKEAGSEALAVAAHASYGTINAARKLSRQNSRDQIVPIKLQIGEQCGEEGSLFPRKRPGTNTIDLIRDLTADSVNLAKREELRTAFRSLNEAKTVTVQIRHERLRLSGRRHVDNFSQRVHASTAVAAVFAAKSESTSNPVRRPPQTEAEQLKLENSSALTVMLREIPVPTVQELAQSFRLDDRITANVMLDVLPYIAYRVHARETVETSAKEILAAGAVLFVAWCQGNPTMKQLLTQGPSDLNKANIDVVIGTIRQKNFRPCRQAHAETGHLTHDERRERLAKTLDDSLTEEQKQARNMFIGLNEELLNDVILPLNSMMNQTENRSLLTVMMVGGLIKYGLDNSDKYRNIFEGIHVVATLVGVSVAFTTPLGPAVGVPFAVGDALANHVINQKRKKVHYMINDLRTSIMSAAQDAGFGDQVQPEFMFHLDMALGGMGIAPVYEQQ
jgi:hypothetical protein